MNELDRWSAMFWVAISIAICVHSLKLGIGTLREPGVAFLFFLGGLTLAFLGLLLLLKSILQPDREGGPGGLEQLKKVRWIKVLAVLFAMVVYSLIFEWMGALVSTAIFIGLLMRSIEPKRWHITIFVAVISSLSVYVLFKTILKVRLPIGLLGF